VTPARSTGPALFVGGAAIDQLWLFWIAPIVGAVIGRGLSEAGARQALNARGIFRENAVESGRFGARFAGQRPSEYELPATNVMRVYKGAFRIRCAWRHRRGTRRAQPISTRLCGPAQPILLNALSLIPHLQTVTTGRSM
jgi:hypothetical protein